MGVDRRPGLEPRLTLLARTGRGLFVEDYLGWILLSPPTASAARYGVTEKAANERWIVAEARR